MLTGAKRPELVLIGRRSLKKNCEMRLPGIDMTMTMARIASSTPIAPTGCTRTCPPLRLVHSSQRKMLAPGSLRKLQRFGLTAMRVAPPAMSRCWRPDSAIQSLLDAMEPNYLFGMATTERLSRLCAAICCRQLWVCAQRKAQKIRPGRTGQLEPKIERALDGTQASNSHSGRWQVPRYLSASNIPCSRRQWALSHLAAGSDGDQR